MSTVEEGGENKNFCYCAHDFLYDIVYQVSRHGAPSHFRLGLSLPCLSRNGVSI